MKKISILTLAVILCSMISCDKDKNEPNAPKFVEAVDLGLSVKWATCNVGATSPEDYGDYFAWGETAPKTVYSWSTYKWCNGTSDSQVKYCINSDDGTIDNKKTLELADDAAYVNKGGNWRMPTYDELYELKNQCTWTWTKQNNVNGYKIVGPNGNSIFLPAAGYYNDMYGLNFPGSYGAYWSSSLGTRDDKGMCSSTGAYNILFHSNNVVWRDGNRCNGLPVRPVCSK